MFVIMPERGKKKLSNAGDLSLGSQTLMSIQFRYLCKLLMIFILMQLMFAMYYNKSTSSYNLYWIFPKVFSSS